MSTCLGRMLTATKDAPRSNRSPRPWQRGLLIFYVILLGLVMPFICWGALAEPNHPHRTPHFVFTDPVMVISHTVGGAADAKPHSLQEHLQMLQMQQDLAEAKQTATGDNDQTAPVGRSTLKLLLFSMLVLLAHALWELLRIDRPYALLFVTYLFAKSPGLKVPLPPPRTLPSF